MGSRYLVTRLVLPCGALTLGFGAASFFASCPWAQDALLAVAGAFFSILLAVVGVDRVLDAHDRRRWADVHELVEDRVDRVATMIVSSFRTAFGIGMAAIRLEQAVGGSARDRRTEILRLTEQTIEPVMDEGIRAMTPSAWKSLASNLSNAYGQNERTLVLFGSRIAPNVQAEMLRLSEALTSHGARYQIFFDRLRVPEAQRSPNAKLSPGNETLMLIDTMTSASVDVIDRVKRLVQSPDEE